MTRRAPAREGTAFLVVTIVLPTLLLGGTHRAVQLALLLVFAALLAVRLWRGAAATPARSVVWHPLALGLGGLALASWAQAVPLPPGLLAVLSPGSAAAYATVDGAFGVAPRAAPISLDPQASLFAGVRWAGLCLALLLLLELNRFGRRSAAISRTLVWLGVGVVATGAIAVLAGSEDVLGLFTPRQPGARAGLSGPFVAANHAGQLLVVCLLAALDEARRAVSSGAPPRRRWAAVAAVALIAVGIALTRSRGAMLGAGVAVVACALVALRRRERGALIAPAWALAVGVAAAGLASLWRPELASLTRWSSLGAAADLGKLSYQAVAFELIPRVWRAGLGADAFGAVQLALAPHPNPVHMSALENDWLQLLVDFGVVGVLLVGAAVAVSARASRSQRTRRASRTIGAIALLAFGLQSLVSFALLSSGVVVALLALLAARWLRSRRVASPAARVVVGAGLVVALGGGAVAALSPRAESLEAHAAARQRPLDARHLWSVALAPGVDGETRTRLAARAFELSGNDYPLQLALATWALRQGEAALAWERFARAASEDYAWASRAWNARTRWLDEGAASPHLARIIALARADARFAELALGSYRARGRYAAELALALALEPSPLSLAHRARAAAGLGEMEQAQLWARQLERTYPDDVGACLTAVDIEVAAGAGFESGLYGLMPCFDRFGNEPILLRRGLDWSTRGPRIFRDWQESAAIWASELNLIVAGDDAATADYRSLLARVQAARGQCRAAERSLRLAEDDREGWPRWLLELCPGDAEAGEGGVP